MTSEELQLLKEHEPGVTLTPYCQALVRSGWQMPKLLHTRVSALADEFQIVGYEQYIAGGDGEKLLANPAEPNFRKWFLISEVVRTLYGYPADTARRGTVAGKEVTLLPYGLDLKLANVVLEAPSNDLYFVDLFGPKDFDEDGNWLTNSTKLDDLPPARLRARLGQLNLPPAEVSFIRTEIEAGYPWLDAIYREWRCRSPRTRRRRRRALGQG